MEVMPSLPEEEDEGGDDDATSAVSEAVVGTSADCSGAVVSAVVSGPFSTTASRDRSESSDMDILSLRRLSIVGVAAKVSAL